MTNEYSTTSVVTTSLVDTSGILKKPYTRRLTPDEAGGYTATILEFPGCVAEGDTPNEALNNLDAVAESWLTVAQVNGYEIRNPIDFDGCSGKIALRIPRSLHKQVAELASLEGCSINQYLVTAIAHYAGGKQLAHRLTEWRNLIQLNFNNVNFNAISPTFPERLSGMYETSPAFSVTRIGQSLSIPAN